MKTLVLALGVDRESFWIDLDRRDAEYHYIGTVSFDLAGVNGDRYLGVIQF